MNFSIILLHTLTLYRHAAAHSARLSYCSTTEDREGTCRLQESKLGLNLDTGKTVASLTACT